MDRLLTAGQRLVHSKYLICRLIGKILLRVLLQCAKHIENKAAEEHLPESWEKREAQELREKIWELYKKNQ